MRNCDQCCATVPKHLEREAYYCQAVWQAVEGGVVFLDAGSLHNAGIDAATIHRVLGLDPKETGCYVLDPWGGETDDSRWFEKRLATIHEELCTRLTNLAHQYTAGEISLVELYKQKAELGDWAKRQRVATQEDLARWEKAREQQCYSDS